MWTFSAHFNPSCDIRIFYKTISKMSLMFCSNDATRCCIPNYEGFLSYNKLSFNSSIIDVSLKSCSTLSYLWRNVHSISCSEDPSSFFAIFLAREISQALLLPSSLALNIHYLEFVLEFKLTKLIVQVLTFT